MQEKECQEQNNKSTKNSITKHQQLKITLKKRKNLKITHAQETKERKYFKNKDQNKPDSIKKKQKSTLR